MHLGCNDPSNPACVRLGKSNDVWLAQACRAGLRRQRRGKQTARLCGHAKSLACAAGWVAVRHRDVLGARSIVDRSRAVSRHHDAGQGPL
jgi:hypothetical protein